MIVELDIDGSRERLLFEEFERRVRDGLIPADTPVRFEVLTGEDFVPAGELEFYHALADADQLQLRRSLLRFGFPVVTAAIVGLQLRVYLWSKVPGVSDFLVSHLTNWVPATLERGEVYRLLSYGFLHLSFTHLALNLTFLAYTGWNLERGLGRRNLAALFLFSVFCGGLLSMLMSPGRPSLGASGGDFGLLAASVIYGWKYEDLIPDRARMYFSWGVLIYLVVLLVLGWASPSVDNWGHLGGLLGGAALVTWLEPDALRRHALANRRVRRLALTLSAAIGALLVLRGPSLVPLKDQRLSRGLHAERPSYWGQGWSFIGDQAWISPVGDVSFVTRTGSGPPHSPEEGAALFFQQLRGRAQAVSLIADRASEVDGWPARRLTVSYRDKGVDRVLEALIIPRGAYLHRIYLSSRSDEARHYRPLARRLFAALELSEPQELIAARQRAATNPRSYKAAMDLGRAAAMAGYPEEAERAFVRAYQSGRTGARRDAAAVALLGLYADYELPRSDRVDAMVLAHPSSVDLMVAAARAYAAEGLSGEARRVLDAAEALSPGDFAVAHTRDALGL